MFTKKQKYTIGVLIIIGLILIIAELGYKSYVPNEVRSFMANNKVEIFNNRHYSSVVQNGPWIEYTYELNPKKEFNIDGDFIKDISKSKEDRRKVKRMSSMILQDTHMKTCMNKDLRTLIDHGAGVRFKYMVGDIDLIRIEVVPYTCNLMDNVKKLGEKINEKYNRK